MPAPFVLFCSDPLDPQSVEPDFADEVGPARESGFTVVKLDHDELDRRIDPDAALRKTRFDGPGAAVYRGWMMTAEAYESLHKALADRGVSLITSPAQFAACHHAPGSYEALSEWMPATSWLRAADMDDPALRREVLARFGASPVVVKDWVKSQASGYWKEACYIPDASRPEEADRVIARFRELQGDSLVGGLVFKAWKPLTPPGSAAHEHRAFIVRGKVAGCWPRTAAAAEIGSPPPELLEAIAANVPSPFASADLGRDVDGNWWLLEVGDGQVSGLPASAAATAIFPALAR